MKKSVVYLAILVAGLFAIHCGNDDDSGTGDADTDTDTDTDSDSDVDELNWWLHDDVEAMVYVSWSQANAGDVHVEYQVDGEWRSTPAFDAEAGSQEQLIVGIPYDMDAEWRVVRGGGSSVDGPTITTGPVPSALLTTSITVSDEANWLPEGNFFMTSQSDEGDWGGSVFWTYIVDRQGRYVWAQKTPLDHWTLFAQVSQTGDYILWDEATYWTSWDNGANSTVHLAYLDAEIEEVATPGLHHAFVQLPDGTLTWGSQDHGGGEALVEKAAGSSNETVIWNVDDDWPEGDSGGNGGPESNGIFYQESTDTYLYSFYTNHSIVEVDRGGGTSLWWAGNASGGYSFNPSDGEYRWQHGISYTDTGTLLVSQSENDYYSAREYTVNHTAQTLEMIWEYVPDCWGRYNGDTWRLANGNTLYMVGTSGVVVEVMPNGTEVWRLELPNDRMLGRGELIEDLYDLITPRD